MRIKGRSVTEYSTGAHAARVTAAGLCLGYTEHPDAAGAQSARREERKEL